MPWAAEAAHAGFSSAAPWLPIPPEHRALAVDRQAADPGSLLNFSRRFIAWRRSQPALRHGDLALPAVPPPLFAMVRAHGDARVLALFNWSREPTAVPRSALPRFAPLDAPGFSAAIAADSVTLPPHGVLFGRL
jgi:alpha-glucosidase